MADEKWISILPQIFDLLLHESDRIVDDTSIEKLLAWLDDICSTSDGLQLLLKQETGVESFLSSEKLVEKKACCLGVSFALRLCGVLWSKHFDVNDSSRTIDLFVKSRENESLWDEVIVRHGYLTGLQSLTLSNEGQKWLKAHQGCLLTAVSCISDSSMFVASAARQLIAKFLIASWSFNTSEQEDGYSSEMKWLLELLQKNLLDDKQPPSDSQHRRGISDHLISLLDIVRILLNINFEVGQEILWVSKLFANCVTAAEMADQTVCRRLVDVINGLQMIPGSQNAMDWEKLLSCESLGTTFGEMQNESAQKILLTIPLKWYKKGRISLALDFIAGLLLPNDRVSRCFSPVWPEILACLINAPIEVLMETPLGNNCNGSSETNATDIGYLVAELLSLDNEDLDNNIKRVKKQIEQLLEPWKLTRKCHVDVLLQILYTIKELVTKDTTSYSQHVVKWIEYSLKILVNSSMVANGDQKLLALDVRGNVKVIKTTLSVVTVLLQQLLNQPNLTDSNKKQFFHVLNTIIMIARSSRTDPTVITSTLECIGILLRHGSFLFTSTSTAINDDPNGDSSGVFPYYQRAKEDLGSLIHLRLRDQRWEVKDSALEFVGRLIKLNLEAFSDCIVSASILSLVWESVDDSESYVRSSAWCCIGHLVCNPGLWAKLKEKERLTEFAVLKSIVDVLENESEAFPRRSVMDCLIKWSRDQHPIVYAVLPKPDIIRDVSEPTLSSSTRLAEANNDSEIRSVFSDVIRYSFKDFDWEVKIRGLQLVESIIQNFSNIADHTEGEDSLNESSHSKQCQSQTLADNYCGNLLALLVDLGAALPLVQGVIDCDSLVCEKALKVISTLQNFVHSESTETRHLGSNKTGSEFQPIRNANLCSDLEDQPNKPKENDHPIVTPEQLEDAIESSKVLSTETFNIFLYRLDVSSLTTLCTAIDINVQKDLSGFLDDILIAARNHDDNLLDCY